VLRRWLITGGTVSAVLNASESAKRGITRLSNGDTSALFFPVATFLLSLVLHAMRTPSTGWTQRSSLSLACFLLPTSAFLEASRCSRRLGDFAEMKTSGLRVRSAEPRNGCRACVNGSEAWGYHLFGSRPHAHLLVPGTRFRSLVRRQRVLNSCTLHSILAGRENLLEVVWRVQPSASVSPIRGSMLCSRP
jgi:hypothetical protein